MASCINPNENTVIYKLFPLVPDENKSSNSTIKEHLEIKAEDYVNKVSGFLNSYIWQNDSFNLHVQDTASSPHLEGLTCYEDNVEDEWFIVYLLYYLTSKDKNLVVQVQDEDGEFILIQAAEYLPKWLNPDTSENRVFIYQGSLHIIPMARSPSDVTPLPSGIPSLSSAVSVVREFSSLTKVSNSIQDSINLRIKSYPQKINENKHRAHCYVPCSVAAILKEDPHLVSPAVKAFYLRDPADVKACQAMKYFAPETRVMTEVVFTKCLYAQLSSQEYEPDKRTGWNLPNNNNYEIKAHKLGMKLACGFEILAIGAEQLMCTDNESEEHNFSNDMRWKRFSKSLKERGYFRNEIEGSELYERLLCQAKDFYLSSLRNDVNYSLNPGKRIQRLLRTVNSNYEEMKEAEKLLAPPDDDSWMEITPDVLDSMLEKMARRPNEIAETITGSLKTFLEQESGVNGVEVPEANKKNKKQKINFDADAFADSVNRILDFRIPNSDDDGSSSSMSGYSDDDEDDVALGEGVTKKMNAGNKGNDAEYMKSYMDKMDRELSKTNVGLSFEKLPPHSMAKDRSKAPLVDSDIDSEEDNFQPVDINLTALKNILESYNSEQGVPGPISSLFSAMDVQLPENADS